MTPDPTEHRPNYTRSAHPDGIWECLCWCGWTSPRFHSLAGVERAYQDHLEQAEREEQQ